MMIIPKYGVITKIVGGIAHVATLGIPAGIQWARGKPTWPGFGNSEEICPVCGKPPGSDGCSDVNRSVYIQTKVENKVCIN